MSCIQSLQVQTFTDYEHLIIDGGSTDGTLEILRKASSADSRIKFISEPDAGMYDAVNKGLRKATSGILAYLNTDDFYLPQTLERVISAFYEKSDVSLVYGHWMSWHPEINFLEMLPVFSYTAADMTVFAVLPQPSVFFRREVFEKLGGFDLSYKLLADNDFFSKAVVAGFKCIRIDDYLSIQTVHSGNLLAGNSTAVLLAQDEGERYRVERLQQLTKNKSQLNLKLLLLLASIKKRFLPITWRLNLIRRLVTSVIPGTAEYRLKLLAINGRAKSILALVEYLTARNERHRFAFYKVGHSDIASCLGFSLPTIEVGSTNPASDVQK